MRKHFNPSDRDGIAPALKVKQRSGIVAPAVLPGLGADRREASHAAPRVPAGAAQRPAR